MYPYNRFPSDNRRNNAAAQQPQQSQQPQYNHFNPNVFLQQPPPYFPPNISLPQHYTSTAFHQQQQQTEYNRRVSSDALRDRVDREVTRARRELAGSGESVSAWTVVRMVLKGMNVESWSVFGFSMQEVASLNRLMVLEGKINAFIHCFVATQRITSLHDLEVVLCKDEGVEHFEDLEMGSLLRHPLISHYFGVNADEMEVFKITTTEIISLLSEFMESCKKKDVKPEDFLSFIAKKRSVVSSGQLGVRIQNLGMHIHFIREAKKLEKTCLDSSKQTSGKSRKHRPLFSEKKKLDERFAVISKYVKTFSSKLTSSSSEGEDCESYTDEDDERVWDNQNHHKPSSNISGSSERPSSCPYPSVTEEKKRLGLKYKSSPTNVGKHIRFISSSSEDEDSNENRGAERKGNNDSCSDDKLSSQNRKASDRVNSCPYPSVFEEMRRAGRSDANPATHESGYSENTKSSGKKRKLVQENLNISVPSKLRKREKGNKELPTIDNCHKANEVSEQDEVDLSLSDKDIQLFITTWKELCRQHNVAEIFSRMLQFYDTSTRRTKKARSMFSKYPFIGLLNIAVNSMKSGMWDSVYDTLQTITHNELTNTSLDSSPQYESLEAGVGNKNSSVIAYQFAAHKKSVTVEDIITKVATYFEVDQDILRKKSLTGKKFFYLRKLYSCEFWLAEQFSVKDFKSLGYGEFLDFLENHSSLLPNDICKLLIGTCFEKSPLEVCMHQHQLVVLMSQAFSSLTQNETITNQMFSVLLTRQFPSLSLKIDGSVENFLDTVGKHKNDVASKCVLYSVTLLRTFDDGNSIANTEENASGTTTSLADIGQSARTSQSVTHKDALEILLKAPMLSDLSLWSQWELMYAPSLGPLVAFLLNEVNSKDLMCLVTKEGKVIRIDHSATADSFLKAALRGSAFQTAVKLVSYFSLVGGEKHAPLSLLKCHAQHAFEVLLKNCQESIGQSKSIHSSTERFVSSESKVATVASTFFLECLAYLPSEFQGFAADILLSGMKSIIKDAPSIILHECNKMDQRLMLHKSGLSLGIVEWIQDYQAFLSVANTDLLLAPEASCLKGRRSLSPSFGFDNDRSNRLSPSENEMLVSLNSGDSKEIGLEKNINTKYAYTCGDMISNQNGNCTPRSSVLAAQEDAALVIESIRCDEFGLDGSISDAEGSMLKKQHARLGRALNCLAQELYSQDSHFLLELVQNADDNYYMEHVEPTLTFILQESSIIVLNNEQGFTAQNIRALCDIGNSTKKGFNGGYIGQKGIGFKSVFRVTDAPEIHSNGFHVKFDISEGQIGFVLPQVVPPCNINLFSRLARSDHDQLNNDFWNTCIVLPLKSKLCEGAAMSGIMNMFSDLHPSLLLFLNRLHCIKFRNMINDSFIVMRKEVVGNGIIKVSYGREKMTWMVVSQQLDANVIRQGVKSTKIALAFTLQEAEDGSYRPCLDHQPVFAFLPLRNYGLKFILQGDFVLPSSREEVDGDSAWNQWLLSEFPGLFISAERSFCSLPCFRESLGKAVSVYLSFVPLVGEVHGFFSSLPRMILSKLRMSNCLLIDGNSNEWVPPCKVLRGWNQQARMLLPDSLLQEHLGLGFLDKDIELCDSLAKALGVEQYGPKVLLQVMSSLCREAENIKLLGMGWLSSLLSSLFTMSFHSSAQNILNSGIDMDIIKHLQKIPFIPLSNGTYSSVDEGPIWLQYNSLDTGLDDEHGLEYFPILNARLRTVSPALLSIASADSSGVDMPLVDNITKMLLCIGVQHMSAHEILKVHVLPTLSNESVREKNIMTEYLSFAMIHLQSRCPNCHVEKEFLISELRNKAFIVTNYGFKRAVEFPIHFTKDYGNPVEVNKLINVKDFKWHELDVSYLTHPVTKSLSCGLAKWRNFFEEIGITDFVQVIPVEKSLADIPDSTFKSQVWDWDLTSSHLIAKDWESPELENLLSILSTNGEQDNCKYLLEVLDKFWDNYFSNKTTGYCFNSSGDSKSFKSSLLSCIHDVQWVASSMGSVLHYPKDLFHDCDAVQSLLGSSAPYAVPKISSEKLLADIGFKTNATLDDILELLGMWRNTVAPFKASLAQMSRLYTFIWKEMTSCKQKLTERLQSPFIFVPYASCSGPVDLVAGTFLSSQDVYWHESTGCMDQTEKLKFQCALMSVDHQPMNKTLCTIYPGLHDFFVNKCGVLESPTFCTYLYLLQQLSTVALPSQAASTVFRVFLKWTDGLDCKSLNSEDIMFLKENLKKLDFAVLPTKQDKWVSLHPSFGLVCWCDDEKLGKEFKHMDNIDFLYFGELGNHEKEMLKQKVSVLMRFLEIPALSEVVIREAIYYNLANSSLKISLLNWALPYAQRYMYKLHPDKYFQLKSSGFEIINSLRVVVVEKLYYRNIIRISNNASEKRCECSCLLQDSILYTTLEADSHALFLEFSRLFFDGTPELHLANFLHMITTMAESGSTEEQMEFFILNCQNVAKLPDEESVWSLSSVTLSEVNNDLFKASLQLKTSAPNDEKNPTKSKNRAETDSNWPPVDWKIAPGFDYAHENGFKTQPTIMQESRSEKKVDDSEGIITQGDTIDLIEIDANGTTEGDMVANSVALIPQKSQTINEQFLHSCYTSGSATEVALDPANLTLAFGSPEVNTSSFSRRDQLRFGTPNTAQAMLTGRQGEHIAFKYLTEKVGKSGVNWVNEDTESGLPYDIVIEDKDYSEYVEVKATRSPRKDWFNISWKEWQFAVDKGESYSIAHVVLLPNNSARVSVFKNPLKLCQQGRLQLVLLMPITQ